MNAPQTTFKMPTPDATAAMNELSSWYNRQRFRYPYMYDTGLQIIPNNIPSVNGASGRLSSVIQTQADDFLVKRIWGFARGPVNAQGQVNLASSGTATDYPNPINTNLAVSGISVKITDTKSGRVWMQNPVPIELITPKGYANQSNAPYDFEWLLPGNSTLQFEWFNSDTRPVPGTDPAEIQYHAAFILLGGERFNGIRATP